VAEDRVRPAALLSFLSGFVALSYEIVWYRALSFMSEGRAETFALMLSAYLAGLALGALSARRVCLGDRRGLLVVLFRWSVAANLAGYLVVPMLGWLASRDVSWKHGLWGVAAAAAGLGAIFPLVSHAWIDPDARVGRRVSHVYLANILGSTSGSLITGFVLMDLLTLGGLHVLLGVLGLALSAAILSLGAPVKRVAPGVILLVLGVGCGLFGRRPFETIYEKLQLKGRYEPGTHFAHVVETRSGVITVNAQGQIFGGGIYDGAFNTSLTDDKNAILRCYALSVLHPAPREALMIGLSSGSWASVLSRHPGLERLTVIEINPGYLELLPQYPDVADLLKNPKVRVEIDDGRRWLARNKDRKFDLIVANATFHWRSNATNLLSREFLELVRSRLNEGGIYYFNTTGSDRVLKTGASVFRHALRIMAFLAVSDSPISLDPTRLKEALFRYPRGTGVVLNRTDPADRERAEQAVRKLVPELETGERLLSRLEGRGELITDDNMGTEWERR
jgi:spermidine synthase